MDTDVLIAGAGPVGLTAAYELTRRGIAVRIIDAALGPTTTSRAIATHPRTLETYDQIGVLDEILARGLKISAFTVFANGRRLARLDADYDANPTRFPFTIAIDQVATEEILRTALAGLGVEVEWGTALRSFEQDDHRVQATLDGDRVVTAGWLLGCDGGHSTVRKALDLPLVGESTETWLLADARVTTELPPNSIYLVRTEGGMVMLAPLPGESRWRMLDTVDVDHDGDGDKVAARFARKLTSGLGHPVEVASPNWVSVFTAQQRLVPRMRVGRVFVAGDAAHVHSPASGQGMNTGIQEAYNLAWKLAMVLDGYAGDELLDTYGAERVPVGQELIGSTKQATSAIALKNKLAGIGMPIVFGLVRNLPPLRRRMQRMILGRVSGLGVRYPDSPLTRPDDTPGPGPRPGERVVQVLPPGATGPGWVELVRELRDLRWTLLVVDGWTRSAAARAADARYGAWLSVRTVTEERTSDDAAGPKGLADPGGELRAALGTAPGGWLLIRPDGYVAARGDVLTVGRLEAAFAPLGTPAPASERAA